MSALVQISQTQLIINYFIMLFVGVGLLWFFFLKSFLPAWFAVRKSQGNQILVHVANPLMDYYKAGKLDNGFLYYKARKRVDNPDPNRMLFVGDVRAFSYKAFGVNVIDVDDIKNCVWSRYGEATVGDHGKSSNYTAVSTNNAEAYDEAQYTALHKPSTKKAMFDEYTWQIISLISWVVILGAIAFAISKIVTLDNHLRVVYDITVATHDYVTNTTTLVQ